MNLLLWIRPQWTISHPLGWRRPLPILEPELGTLGSPMKKPRVPMGTRLLGGPLYHISSTDRRNRGTFLPTSQYLFPLLCPSFQSSFQVLYLFQWPVIEMDIHVNNVHNLDSTDIGRANPRQQRSARPRFRSPSSYLHLSPHFQYPWGPVPTGPGRGAQASEFYF